MWKILLLLGLVLIISASFYWIKDSPLIKTNLTSKNQPPGKVLVATISNLFNQTKQSLEKTSQNITNTVKEQAYNQAQNTVNTVFDKPNPTISPSTTTDKVTVNILGVSNPPTGSFIIDFSKDSNLKLSLSKGVKYYLQFKNTPQNYCLYIADNKYEIIDSRIIELQFNLGGTYPIRLNSCEVNDKNIGELVVQ